MAEGREIELKLELVPGDAPRVFEHPILTSAALGPAEVQHLRSVYFDSRDLALMQHGIAVRLRRSDARQVLTVKLGDRSVGGLFSRGEVEVEHSGERPELAAIPDPDLRTRLLEILAGQPLEPIFETEMKRTHQPFRDGSAEWSVDLDEGEVRAGFAREPISELELELHAGPPSRLFEIALALSDSVPLWPGTRSKADRGHALRTGERPRACRAQLPELASDATLDEAVAAIAESCLAQISLNSEPAREGIDPEGVHQMRVGIRRLRALISLLRRVAPSARVGRIRTQLRWLASLLGEVRDLDVFIELLGRPLARRRDDDLAIGRLYDKALEIREERLRLLQKGLRSRRYTHLMLDLGRWIAILGEESGASEASSVPPDKKEAAAFAEVALARLHRRAEKLGRRALTGPPAARHELRIALKKLRYACEFFASLYDARDAGRYLRRLARLQDLLGALNDVETARRLLQELAARGEPEQAFALARAAGFVEGFVERDEERTLGQLEKRWERFRKAGPFWPDRA